MANCDFIQLQMASIMEILTKTAVSEIIKLVEDGSAALRLEMRRSQRENEALKTKLVLMEGELRAVRGYGEGTPGNSLNLSFEVQVCEEFREAQKRELHTLLYGNDDRDQCYWRAVHSVFWRLKGAFDEQLSTDPAKDDRNIPTEKKEEAPDALDIKYEVATFF